MTVIRGAQTGRRRSRWSRAVVATLALAVVGVGVWMTRGGTAPREAHPDGPAAEPATATVQVVRPTPGGIQRKVDQPASILAFETVDLYAMVSGYLKAQSVDIGSRIKKGEVLAEINVPRDAKAVEEAASLVEQARAKVEQAKAMIKVAEAQHDAAEAMANQAVSEVNRLKAERVLAEKQFARIDALLDRRAVDERLLDEHQKAVDAARAAEQTAKIAIETARAHTLAAAAEVEKAKVDADAAEASLGVAEASRDRLEVNLQYARIVAPFDGVVTQRNFHPGALIHSATGGGSGLPLLTVKRTDLMRVVVLIPDRDVVRTKVGGTAVVKVDALDGRTFEGTLARVSRSENSQRLMRVEIDLPNPESLLYDGMYGQATIALERNAKSVAVPPSCVFERTGRSGGVVYVARDGVARRTEVQIAGDNGSLVEIESGVGPNDLLIVRSGTPIEDGMKVTAAAGPAPDGPKAAEHRPSTPPRPAQPPTALAIKEGTAR